MGRKAEEERKREREREKGRLKTLWEGGRKEEGGMTDGGKR